VIRKKILKKEEKEMYSETTISQSSTCQRNRYLKNDYNHSKANSIPFTCRKLTFDNNNHNSNNFCNISNNNNNYVNNYQYNFKKIRNNNNNRENFTFQANRDIFLSEKFKNMKNKSYYQNNNYY